ncbi:MAG: TraR/DksA family transcriptional regulator [Gammaproteobacteria bacterium]|nr:TraR/DksA family transcriptional regulator [Gammaproteobacteria bacterium]
MTDQQRQQLLARKAELMSRRTAIHKDLAHETRPLETGGEDQAVSHNNDDVLDGLDLAARDEIDRINLALERIDNGTYTRCSSCGKSINPERLQAVPDSTLCINCASE